VIIKIRDRSSRRRPAICPARAPASRPGGLRDLVAEHLRKFPGTAFTPHQVGKVLTRSSGAVANALDKLVSLGTAELACDKPRSYRLAPGYTRGQSPARRRHISGPRQVHRISCNGAGALHAGP